MRITKTQLKKIIKEELGKVTEMYRDGAMPFLSGDEDQGPGGMLDRGDEHQQASQAIVDFFAGMDEVDWEANTSQGDMVKFYNKLNELSTEELKGILAMWQQVLDERGQQGFADLFTNLGA